MASDHEDDDFDDVPLHHKKPFGSGLKRKEIKFVRASTGELSTTDQAPKIASGKSISDLYLNLVLPKNQNQPKAESESVAPELCAVCKLPLSSKPLARDDGSGSIASSLSHHEASLAHQVCLTHSHPPSALDRTRMGLRNLESYGWNPDGRQGLGASGEGIQFPLKVKPKDDTLGLGVVIPKDFEPKKKEKPQKLDAKKIRKMAQEDRKKTEKLQQQLFGRVDLDRYLGDGS
ncbi:putative g-patch domain-containing protein [Phaeoacremonium minimum UCRPA7]|uniref:Putative g-patch domain-containing protein n=1 Tax=Phaeoacremonium minimum (strain UCR-PA7) TaxID=1286976 RepID=R8BBD1_PHAM7|nr:putative g-patch domain-containing protein [Phaeoacremonium minimum UCRPA7]EON96606.1 putative g-patch domain-containing protein [Phaeoacremonium minimum UCRPA7]